MASDIQKKNGTANAYKSDAGGATLYSEPLIGIVKNNIDPTNSGKIDVYLPAKGGPDPDDSSRWAKGLRYLSPFWGVTSPNGNPYKGPDKSGNGEFVGNPQSYGFWASAPDIGTEVLCVFANGNPDQGYYIGCIPKPGLLQMTPAIGASNNVVPNDSEGDSYGGADRLPTSEVNISNPEVNKSRSTRLEPKPVHSSQAAIFNAQGLIRDDIRGPISSSAQRESPSRVFGLSTPGAPIFEGGYTDQTVVDAAKTSDPSKLKQIGRQGGHTFVMDDGTFNGADRLIRLRTGAGHQIMMNDSGQSLFIIHSNGQSWIELGKEGTIDMYSTNSFNVRTQGDINFHADRDININADKNLNLYGENINIESSKATSQRVGTDFTGYTMGSYSYKVGTTWTQSSGGAWSHLAGATATIQAPKIDLNPGSAPSAPEVPAITKTKHTDTINSPTVGWMNPSPNPLVSITNRAPSHQPWVGSGKGVNVTVESSPPPSTSQTTPAVEAVNNTTPEVPTTPTSESVVASVPVQVPDVGPMPGAAIQATVAQIATNSQAAVAADIPSPNMISSVSGLTTGMAEAAGVLKPGASAMVTGLVARGMPMDKALASLGTGAGGLNPASLLTDLGKQANVVAAAVSNTTQRLVSNGTLTGLESPAQAAGLALAGTTQGLAALSGTLASGVASVTGMANDIASGKFAGALADKSIGGLKTSLDGLIGAAQDKVMTLGDSVNDLKNNLKTGLENAFKAVEKSFGKLKAGMPNKLGPPTNGPVQEQSAIEAAGSAYDSATAEIESATDSLLAAKRNFRNDPSTDNQAALQSAEAALSAARQKQAAAGTAFVKGAGSKVVTGIGDIKTSLTSGLNSLPGGPAALQSIIKNTGAGSIIGQATAAVALVDKAMTSATSLASGNPLSGDLMGQAKSAVDKLVGSVPGSLLDLKAEASGMLAQLESSMGSISSGAGLPKVAEMATGTFNKVALVAKTGQLLGNPKIPSPFPPDTPPKAMPNEVSAEVAKAYDDVKEARYKLNAAKLNLSITKSTSSLVPGGQSKVEEVTLEVQKAEEALLAAEKAYSATVST